MEVILLHGALGSSFSMQPLSHLLKDSFDVFTMNFRGHGVESDATAFTMKDLAKDIAALIHREGLQRPAIMGYSMGGYAALQLAAQSPGVAGSIMTLGTKFAWSPEFAKSESKMLDPDLIREKVPALADVLWERHGNKWEQLCLATAEMMKQLGAGPEIEFARIESPVLITRGELDKMVTREESEGAADKLGNGRFYEFPNMPHQLEKANLQEVANRFKAFVM